MDIINRKINVERQHIPPYRQDDSAHDHDAAPLRPRPGRCGGGGGGVGGDSDRRRTITTTACCLLGLASLAGILLGLAADALPYRVMERSRVDALRSDLNRTRTELSDARAQLADLRTAGSGLGADLRACRTEAAGAEGRLAALQGEKERLVGDLVAARDELAAAEENDAAPSDEETSQEDQVTNNKTMESYTLKDAILEADVFKFSFFVIIYDPENDKFLGYYSKRQRIAASFQKLKSSMKDLAVMLRKSFPERFTPSSPEFAVAIKAGDYPHIISTDQIPHVGVAPVLQFGSVFRDVNMYPNMIAMPMPGLFLKCFSEWSYTHSHSICSALRPIGGKTPVGELAFGEELGLEWDNLIPQLVWRGTDFGFLPLLVHPKPFSPFALPTISQKLKVASKETDQLRRMVATSEALRESFDKLLPRWKGVSLTADAELAAKDEDKLPWANIKFANYNDSGIKPTLGSDRFKLYEEAGIAVGDYMSREDQAKYKYHIDIGGGGGTTWTGTTTKLAMPGLLFHHVTPTKDFIHDRLKPYEHFVPVSPDLSDLKEKFDWAESHPEEAKRIADQATKFMRHLGTPEGFEQMFEEDFVQPLRRVIEAYQPTSTILPSELRSKVGTLTGKTWMDVLQSPEGSHMERLLECSGLSTHRCSCEVVGEKAARFAEKDCQHYLRTINKN